MMDKRVEVSHDDRPEKVRPSVWVIEEGDYSDYRVVGVFSMKENAERVNALIGGHAEVSEWRLDPVIEELNAGLRFYMVGMAKDGAVRHCELRTDVSGYEIREPMDGTPWVDFRDHSKGVYLNAYVWASDDRHAVKIANERRLRMIANNEWRDA